MKPNLLWSVSTVPDPGNLKDWKGDKESFWDAWREHRDSFVYEKECPICQTVNRVYTQRDDSPEYYSVVFIDCRQCCGKIRFELPVN